MTKVGPTDHAATMVLCFAEGRGNNWEALCLDFDLAVQGRSFEDVYRKLDEQICLYLESIDELPEEEREHFLNRSVPLWTKLGCLAKGFIGLLRQSSEKERHDYTRPIRHGGMGGALPA